MELFILYLWLQLPGIFGLLLALTIASAICLAGISVYSLPWMERNEVDNERIADSYFKKLPKLIGIVCFFVCSATFLPSKTDVAVLIGGHYAMKLADTPEAGKVVSLLRKKANEMLDEELAKK